MTKSATLKELADVAGVSRKTMSRWMKPIVPRLKEIGFKKNMKVLTPSMVEIICNHLALDMDEKREERGRIGNKEEQ